MYQENIVTIWGRGMKYNKKRGINRSHLLKGKEYNKHEAIFDKIRNMRESVLWMEELG